MTYVIAIGFLALNAAANIWVRRKLRSMLGLCPICDGGFVFVNSVRSTLVCPECGAEWKVNIP